MNPRPILNKICSWASYGAVVSLVAMIAIVTLQIFARSFLEKAPPWTEELSRMCFLYAIAFGLGPAIRSKKLVRIELVDTLFAPTGQKILKVSINALCVLFASLLCVQSWNFAQSGAFERSPALGIQMSLLFTSTLILALSMLLAFLEQALPAEKE